MSTLSEKRVVIIGGSSGIGLAVAESAAAQGAKVVIGSSNAANVEAAVQRIGGTAGGGVVDVGDESSVARFFGNLGEIDHLVFTAGDWRPRGPATPIQDLDLDDAAAGLKVRFWGALRAIKHAAPRMSPNGSITLTDGVLAHRPQKGAPLMTAFIGAIEHLARGLAVDLAPLRVNAVCPGIVMTDRWKAAPEGLVLKLTERQPLPRGADPGEVAQAYLYLMLGGYTTGQVLIVDGGRTLV